MKEIPTHYYCHLVGGIQTKNKLQGQFSCFLREMDGELYQAKELSKIKEYIIEKAKELNEEFPRCKPLNISFAQYSEKDKHHLCGFEFSNFILMPAYLIKI
ncbi:hypothetical protein [Capnocytophaga sputigena]|jgi:hypothetical protein|uniref:Uncharacterized protein n=1 Tax=Capnocytophaga sputigena TaxID=1019 RepID=A0AAX2I970_CAPSP|nr:hypothetical protein [Capnocytophaga sputigena]SQA74540.1 Uncharacterised protein [Capnocytophaga sputigena]